MSTEELWNRILASIAGQVSTGCWETWLRPLRALKLDQSVLELEVPSEAFSAAIAENYLNLLTKTAAEVAGRQIEIRLSCCQPEQG
jgi:chromosomal replication initiator protein